MAVAIVGILIGLIVGAIHKARQKTATAQAAAQIHDMKIALEQYNTDHGSYPTSGNKKIFQRMSVECGAILQGDTLQDK